MPAVKEKMCGGYFRVHLKKIGVSLGLFQVCSKKLGKKEV